MRSDPSDCAFEWALSAAESGGLLLYASLSIPGTRFRDVESFEEDSHFPAAELDFSTAIHTNYTPNCPPESDPDWRRLYWQRHSPQNACQLPDWVVYGFLSGKRLSSANKKAVGCNWVAEEKIQYCIKGPRCTLYCLIHLHNDFAAIKIPWRTTWTTGSCSLATDSLRPVDEPVGLGSASFSLDKFSTTVS